MELLIVFLVLFTLLLIKVPIFLSLMAATLVGSLLNNKIHLIEIVRSSITGIDSLVLFAAPLFVLSGKLILHGGISERLILWINYIFGFAKLRLTFVNVFGSMFFGGISGSATADSAAIGSVLIPEMEKQNYPKNYSAAITAASSSIGIIVPPSVPMILAGSVTSVSVMKLFVGGYGPGVLIALSLAITAYLLRPGKIKEEKIEYTPKNIFNSTYRALPAIIFPLIIMVGILSGIFTATEAAAVAVFYAAAIALLIYRNLNSKMLMTSLIESAQFTTIVFLIVSSAQAFARYLTLIKFPQQLSEYIFSITDDPILIKLIIILLLLFLGTFMETVPIVIVLYPIIEPIAIAINMDPIHYGLVFMTTIAIGMLTPPYGILIFVNSKIAKINSKKLIKSLLPYICVLIIDVLLITFIPEIVLAPVNYFYN